MKLTRKKILELLEIMEQGKGAYQARKNAGISVGRVYQIWNEYKRTGKIPELGKNIGRPQKPITKQEEKIVKQSYELYRELCKIA